MPSRALPSRLPSPLEPPAACRPWRIRPIRRSRPEGRDCELLFNRTRHDKFDFDFDVLLNISQIEKYFIIIPK
jgi:hypothetical protein